MIRARMKAGVLSGFLAAALVFAGTADVAAQNTKMPTTMRYGSGFIDVPDATVLPHLSITGTYSGFYVDLDRTVLTDDNGLNLGFGPGYTDWRQDGSITLGLFDRVELGATFQNFSDAATGGTMAGGFGRVAILRPEDSGLGLAVGARYVTFPTFDDIDPNRDYRPGRLGFPDDRYYFDENGPESLKNFSSFTPYVVGNFMFEGIKASWMPDYDVTLTGGWGDGMFKAGRDLDFYANAHSWGFFGGVALHSQVGENTILNLIGDWNGFDANVGAELNWKGARLGAYILGVNYFERITEYKSPKLAAKVSFGLCMGDDDGSLLCKPRIMERAEPEVVQLPAPPADTVVVEREVAPPMPTGTATNICLATGRSERVWVTASGDTLVGPNRVSISSLGGVVFEGTYADGMDWFTSDENITFQRATYQQSGGEVSLNCTDIMIVGEHNGVNLFADRNADQPYETIYVPVRPGVWQAYQTGLRGTRG